MLYSNQLDGFNVPGEVCHFGWTPNLVVPSTATDWLVTGIGLTAQSPNSSYASDTAWIEYTSTLAVNNIAREFTALLQDLQGVYFTAATAIFGAGGNPYEILSWPDHPEWQYYSVISSSSG